MPTRPTRRRKRSPVIPPPEALVRASKEFYRTHPHVNSLIRLDKGIVLEVIACHNPDYRDAVLVKHLLPNPRLDWYRISRDALKGRWVYVRQGKGDKN